MPPGFQTPPVVPGALAAVLRRRDGVLRLDEAPARVQGCRSVVSTESTIPARKGNPASAAGWGTGPVSVGRGASWPIGPMPCATKRIHPACRDRANAGSAAP